MLGTASSESLLSVHGLRTLGAATSANACSRPPACCQGVGRCTGRSLVVVVVRVVVMVLVLVLRMVSVLVVIQVASGRLWEAEETPRSGEENLCLAVTGCCSAARVLVAALQCCRHHVGAQWRPVTLLGAGTRPAC